MRIVTFFLFIVFLLSGCASTPSNLEQRRSELEKIINSGINGEKAKVFVQGNTVRARIYNNILFDLGSSQVKNKFHPIVKRLSSYLKSHSQITLVIEGHTDTTGTAKYNKILSVKRAKSVKSTFSLFGISGSRIRTIGLGESKPIAGASHTKNRRVEIIFQESKQLATRETSSDGLGRGLSKLKDSLSKIKIKDDEGLINKRSISSKKASKMVGRKVKWTEYKNIDSDDCILFGSICHSVKYRFQFIGTVQDYNAGNNTYKVKLSSAQLISQSMVAPMYWKYKGRAQNWASSQRESYRYIEPNYTSSL